MAVPGGEAVTDKADPHRWPEGRIVAGRYLDRYGSVPDRLQPYLDNQPDADPEPRGAMSGTVGFAG